MKCQIFTTTSMVIISLLHLQMLHAAPSHSNDIDYNDNGNIGGGGSNGYFPRNNYANNNSQMDFNSVFGHVKDFFMYLPVMMTTLKESMNGFPKFAEGIRILTSKNGRVEDSDCNCDKGSNENGNRQFG